MKGRKMRKDDLVVVSVEDMSSEGMGVGHVDGLALFVKDTVIGAPRARKSAIVPVPV